MKLKPIQIETVLWKEIEGELKERLQILREKNDGALTPDETARVRGQIFQIKEILNWAHQDPQM